MTAANARAIIAWQYEPPYDFYNADPDTYEIRAGKRIRLEELRAELLDAEADL